MKTLFRKTILSTGLLGVFALVAALAMAAIPFVNVFAAGDTRTTAYDPPVPPQGQVTNERLELVWARQRLTYERIGIGFESDDLFAEKIQRLIDRAKANGKDVSAVQVALDAFEAALKKTHPIYESTKGIIDSHQGFDENGKVTDLAKARETVKSTQAKFKEIRDAMNGTGKALREAIKAFREANPRPEKAPTGTSG